MNAVELRAARLAQGLSQDDLAILAGVSRGTVKAAEGGKYPQRPETTALLVDALTRRPAAAMPSIDLTRIAAALERIAASLERAEAK